MIKTITFDDLSTDNEKFRSLTELIGKNFGTITYEGNISVHEELSNICLIEIWIEAGTSNFAIESEIYEIKIDKYVFADFVTYLSYFGVKFRILDDGIYIEDASLNDTRFIVTIENQIGFYFEFQDLEKVFELTKIGIREIFVPKMRPKQD
ncbi:hypothetical protein LJR090_004176 [Bosea sp. LjRoot90]|uniref:hypothetical protein n=1 Tax=Bosea sp. LjRoot90 TaxID=3342342 RepID=UPI003ECFAA6F